MIFYKIFMGKACDVVVQPTHVNKTLQNVMVRCPSSNEALCAEAASTFSQTTVWPVGTAPFPSYPPPSKEASMAISSLMSHLILISSQIALTFMITKIDKEPFIWRTLRISFTWYKSTPPVHIASYVE